MGRLPKLPVNRGRGNAGPDDGRSPIGPGEDESERLAEAQAMRGAEPMNSSQASELPVAASMTQRMHWMNPLRTISTRDV